MDVSQATTIAAQVGALQATIAAQMDALQATVVAQGQEIVRLQERVQALEITQPQKLATLPADEDEVEDEVLVENTLSRYREIFRYQLMLLWSMSQDVKWPETSDAPREDMAGALGEYMADVSEAFFSEQGVGAQCSDEIIEIVKSDVGMALFTVSVSSSESIYALIKGMSKLGATQCDAEKKVADIVKGFSDKYRADISLESYHLDDWNCGTDDLEQAIRTLSVGAWDGVKADVVLGGEGPNKRLKTESISLISK